jgi:endonuclease/exonuclease/phosphatase family metal-dependent hydrolase
MTYNIRHGEGMDGRVDIGRIAGLIKTERADIVALQEVDRRVERTQRRDLPAELAVLTGMTCIFSNNYPYQGGEYGNAILTRFPVRHTVHLLFKEHPTPEVRGLLQTTLDVDGHPLCFMVTHLDSGRDDSARWSCLAEIEQTLAAQPIRPVLLCGDFNAAPSSRIYERLRHSFDDTWTTAGAGDGFTIPSELPNRRIDYVWLSGKEHLEPFQATVPDSQASDHRPVVAEFRWTHMPPK